MYIGLTEAQERLRQEVNWGQAPLAPNHGRGVCLRYRHVHGGYRLGRSVVAAHVAEVGIDVQTVGRHARESSTIDGD